MRSKPLWDLHVPLFEHFVIFGSEVKATCGEYKLGRKEQHCRGVLMENYIITMSWDIAASAFIRSEAKITPDLSGISE